MQQRIEGRLQAGLPLPRTSYADDVYDEDGKQQSAHAHWRLRVHAHSGYRMSACSTGWKAVQVTGCGLRSGR